MSRGNKPPSNGTHKWKPVGSREAAQPHADPQVQMAKTCPPPQPTVPYPPPHLEKQMEAMWSSYKMQWFFIYLFILLSVNVSERTSTPKVNTAKHIIQWCSSERKLLEYHWETNEMKCEPLKFINEIMRGKQQYRPVIFFHFLPCGSFHKWP